MNSNKASDLNNKVDKVVLWEFIPTFEDPQEANNIMVQEMRLLYSIFSVIDLLESTAKIEN